jgi:hypothetical protein
MVEPFGKRGIDVVDVAVGIDREKAGRRMIEIVDGVLQLLKHIFVALEFSGDVGDVPYGQPHGAPGFVERANAHA